MAAGSSSYSCFRGRGAAEGLKGVWDGSAEVIPKESLGNAVNVALEKVQGSSAEVIPEESLEDAVNVELQKVQQPWAPWAVGI